MRKGNKVKERNCIVGISGSYVAWHEISIYIVYIFGIGDKPKDIFNNWLYEDKDIDVDNTDIADFDELALEWISEFKDDGYGYDCVYSTCIESDDGKYYPAI